MPPEAPAVPALDASSIHVWSASIAVAADHVASLGESLSDQERAEAARYVFDRDRRMSAFSRGLRRALLGAYVGARPASLRFASGAHGKPRLADDALAFNVSHSGEMLVVAVARAREIGVDIERVRADPDLLSVAEHFFSLEEQRVLASLPAEQRGAAFIACWTRKEAFIKAIGYGLHLALDAFDVELHPARAPALLAVRAPPFDARDWSLRALGAPIGYAAALAFEAGDATIVPLAWPPHVSRA